MHDMHGPNSLDNTRSASLREPAQVATVSHKSMFREASLASSRSDEHCKNISKHEEGSKDSSRDCRNENFIPGRSYIQTFHGRVDPLCGTSWDKWNWDKLHRGYRACPGTRKDLQRGYMTCPMGQGEVSFDLSQSQCLSQSACPTGAGCACPNGLSQWDKPARCVEAIARVLILLRMAQRLR